jgi:hypothetical protein
MKKHSLVHGQKFNNWTVLEKSEKQCHWICQCACGRKGNVSTGNLVHARSKGCKRCQADRLSEKMRTYFAPGSRHGNWTVIGRDETKRRGSAYFMCRCDCGCVKSVSSHNIKQGQSSSCPECASEKNSGALNHNWKGYEGLSGTDVSIIRWRARKIGRDYTVTNKFLWELYVRQHGKCALSGVDIVLGRGKQTATASLDRIDSSGGYTEDNVQWVHKVLNVAKMDLRQEEFVQWCELVTKFQKEQAP